MRATQGIEFKPLIKTLVKRNVVGMIVAPAKAKKSMLALNLVFSLLTKVCDSTQNSAVNLTQPDLF